MRTPVATLVCGFVTFASGTAAAGELASGTSEPKPVPIFGGVEASECDFPSAVAMLDLGSGSMFCTGSLIHPSVVAFAAHCMDPLTSWATPGSVMFGEDVDAPVREVPVVQCATHPQWDPGSTVFDLAFCTLAEPVTDVPAVPLIMGCEVDLLQPNTELVIVGFGATNAVLEGGDPVATGGGKKRFTKQTITSVSVADNEVIMIGPDQGGCFGDSGGPAYARMTDGTWRVIGAASTLHPDWSPDENGEICGLGTVYEIFWPNMDWLEGATGVDLTPCFDVDGNWAPNANCGGFPSELADAQSTWSDSCAMSQPGWWSQTCGAPFGEDPFPGPQPPEPPKPPEPPPEPPPPEPPPPEPPPEPPPPEPEPEPEPEPPLPPPEPTPPDPLPPGPAPAPEPIDPSTSDDGGDEDSDSATAGAGDGLSDRGCSCAAGQDVSWDRSWLLAGLLLLAPRRRRGSRA